MNREGRARDAAARGKYAPLYRDLSARSEAEWRASFDEVEAILGFRLPDSARLYRPWWSNQRKGGGHSHALAWQAAGWRTSAIDLEAETSGARRTRPREPGNRPAGGGSTSTSSGRRFGAGPGRRVSRSAANRSTTRPDV